jgi:hypothetical protein
VRPTVFNSKYFPVLPARNHPSYGNKLLAKCPANNRFVLNIFRDAMEMFLQQEMAKNPEIPTAYAM